MGGLFPRSRRGRRVLRDRVAVFFTFLIFERMTLTELLTNEELRHHEFPVTRDKIFLAHGGDCPLPRRVAEAVAQYAHDAATGDQEKFVYPKILSDGRRVAGATAQL